MLRSFADGSIAMGPELAESAIDRLQRCLLRQGSSVPSGMALLKCFDSVMMPLLLHYGSSDREKGYIIGVFISTLLASSETLALQPGFSSFWLRVIDVLCKFVSQGGGVGETTTERLKNLLLVMIVEKRFETMSRVSEQNALEATMTMLDSYCPTMRVDLERMLKGDVPNDSDRASPTNGETGNLDRPAEEKLSGGEMEKPSEEMEKPSEEMEKPSGGETEKLSGGEMEKLSGGETEKLSGGEMEKLSGGETEKPSEEMEKPSEETEKSSEDTPIQTVETVETGPSEAGEPSIDASATEEKAEERKEGSAAAESQEGEAMATALEEKEKQNAAASEVFVEPSKPGESDSAASTQEEKTEKEGTQTPEIQAAIIHVQDSE